MKLIQQSNPHNCGSACLAMVLGLPNCERAEALLGREPHTPHPDILSDPPYAGVDIYEISKVLYLAHVPHALFFAPDSMDEGSWLRIGYGRWQLLKSRHVFSHLMNGGQAILNLPSLNQPGFDHWVVVAEKEVFDPAVGERRYGPGGPTLKPKMAVLVGAYQGNIHLH